MGSQKLEVFAEINGIGAASALLWHDGLLYIISDNSGYLYTYNNVNNELKKIQLLQKSTLENISKSEKPDFEALCQIGNRLLIIGSGSTPKRNLMIEYQMDTEKVTTYNLSGFYQKLKSVLKVADDDLNIEGAVFNGKDWFLFNRGNGKSNKNGIFKIIGEDLSKAEQFSFVPLILRKNNGTKALFTDAILHQGQIYFVAAAEDTSSTYNDGQILGSYIGNLNAETLKVNFIKKISSHQKIEGITVFQQIDKKIEFLLCEDSDSESSISTIYKLRL